MASRLQFENNNEIGVFSMLSSSYALVALGASENFYRFGNYESSASQETFFKSQVPVLGFW